MQQDSDTLYRIVQQRIDALYLEANQHRLLQASPRPWRSHLANTLRTLARHLDPELIFPYAVSTHPTPSPSIRLRMGHNEVATVTQHPLSVAPNPVVHVKPSATRLRR